MTALKDSKMKGWAKLTSLFLRYLERAQEKRINRYNWNWKVSQIKTTKLTISVWNGSQAYTNKGNENLFSGTLHQCYKDVLAVDLNETWMTTLFHSVSSKLLSEICYCIDDYGSNTECKFNKNNFWQLNPCCSNKQIYIVYYYYIIRFHFFFFKSFRNVCVEFF